MKILVAYDGSESSDAAINNLPLAGLPPDTEAVVLSVLDDRASDDASRVETEVKAGAGRGDARERQLEVAGRGGDRLLTFFPTWSVTPEVRVGSPAWEIIKRAEGEGDAAVAPRFDLVVAGSRGLGEFKRMLLGSVAHRLVTTLRGSVRVSRGTAERVTMPAGGGSIAPPRLVVGVDGSPDSDAAVEAVASRRWPAGTQIIVATFETGVVAIASQLEPATIWTGAPTPVDAPATASRPAIRFVTDAAEVLRRRCHDALVMTLVRPADPKYGLLGAAEAWDDDGADCIFVGAKGARGIERFLLGSVSTSVAMNATCSVEIVRCKA